MAQNDAEYIRKCQQGETEAFAELVRRYMRLAYVVAYGCVKDEHAANDMTQEAFLKAFRSFCHRCESRSSSARGWSE